MAVNTCARNTKVYLCMQQSLFAMHSEYVHCCKDCLFAIALLDQQMILIGLKSQGQHNLNIIDN